ncbi:DUF6770 family protein [Hymenobacter sp. APR13]|jgi:hypothetical protein|uniref:DUF6770 family protein n=1 Tax=Hymenobacter sp. APR13 TaxID=1356852 RepID=UPI0004E07B67|nr:DUF6770 family protein [Hymenobacter sp. APR13]AII53172.1 hypothetical protein N008_14460 [Hymenobacter sp. APR13]
MYQFTRTLLTAALAIAASAAALAQTQTLDGIKSMPRSGISPIYAGNEVKGYILYARADKADRKNDNFLLDFYDQDLKKVSNITLQKPSGRYTLLQNAFNGTAFGLYFLNTKDNTLEMETYDASLKKLGSKVIEDLSKGDKMVLSQMVRNDGNVENTMGALTLTPIAGKGFVRNSYDGLMRGYALQMYDNNLNPKWRLASDPKSKDYETILIREVTDKYIVGNIMRRDGLMSRQVSSYMVAIDVNTGKKVMELPVETSKTEQLSLSTFTFDAAAREFVAVGEYYKLTDKPFINKSQGFYIKRFTEAGKLIGTKPYSWQKEVKAALPAEAKPSMEDGFMNFTHSIVKGADGKMYIVAEQYKVAADGMGIAALALGGRASAVNGQVGNMMLFVLNPDYSLNTVKFYAKDRSKALLPPGAMGAGLIGMLMKAQGDFDYQFLQRNEANSQFNVVYINYDKEKGEATKKVIGNIAFGDNGQFGVDKIDGNSTATSSYVYPAKPGYVMMVDFLKKQSQLGMKLVKLNI